MKHRHKKLVVISLGALLTVASALLSHVLIKNNLESIESMQTAQSNYEATIDKLWENFQAFHAKIDFAALMVPMARLDNGNSLLSYTLDVIQQSDMQTYQKQNHIKQVKNSEKPEVIYQALKQSLQEEKTLTMNVINDEYIKLSVLKDEIIAIKSSNETIAIFALMLQILGLILVLSKDLV